VVRFPSLSRLEVHRYQDFKRRLAVEVILSGRPRARLDCRRRPKEVAGVFQEALGTTKARATDPSQR
jgi:hypothetical protein